MIVFRFFILALLLSLTACSSDLHQKRQARFQEWIEPNGKVKVLSSTAFIDDIVKKVGADHIDTIVLIEGELDPHSYQLVKGDDEKLAAAQIIFFNGLGLEHGSSLHTYLAKNPRAHSLGDWVFERHPDAIIEVHGQKDPHFWMDISLFAKAVPYIVQNLSRIDPAHAQEYALNGENLVQEMHRAHEQAWAILHRVPDEKRYLVTSHDAFHYFARAYLSEEAELKSGEWKKRFAAPEGLSPESQLSAADIKAILRHLKSYQIHLLFPESNVSRDSIRKIVQAGKEEGIDVQIACCPLYGDAMGEKGSEGDGYLNMILYDAKTLAKHMDPHQDWANGQ